jgi:osmotically-inducible protein OsmY
MYNKRLITGFLSAALVSAMLGLPVAYAGNSAESSPKSTMEQGTENVKAEIKDAWLDGKLEATLLFNEHLDSFSIDTKVENGVAYLNGAVDTDIDRDLAGEIAKSINGVTKVENNLVVDAGKAREKQNSAEAKEREGFEQTVMNATLTARVKTHLLLNSNTSGMAINVDSRDGVVTLSGVVDSDEEKELAVKIAANTDGALSVNDKLKVDEEPQKAS